MTMRSFCRKRTLSVFQSEGHQQNRQQGKAKRKKKFKVDIEIGLCLCYSIRDTKWGSALGNS